MIAACLFPEPEKGGRGQKGSATEQFSGVSRKALSEARTVIRYAPDLVAGAVERHDDGIDLIAPRYIDRIQIRRETAE